MCEQEQYCMKTVRVILRKQLSNGGRYRFWNASLRFIEYRNIARIFVQMKESDHLAKFCQREGRCSTTVFAVSLVFKAIPIGTSPCSSLPRFFVSMFDAASNKMYLLYSFGSVKLAGVRANRDNVSSLL